MLLASALVAALAASQPAGGEADLPGAAHLRHTGEVRALCRVGDTLYVGTGGGLFLYDLTARAVVARLEAGGPLPSSSVRAIRAKGDSILVGTDRGLVIFAPAETTTYTPRSRPPVYASVPFGDIHAIDLGRERVYLSTRGHGVGVLEADSGWALTRADSLLDNTAFGAVEAFDTTTWFATSAGLCAYRDSVWVSFRAGAGIPRGELRAMLPAREALRYFLLVGGYGVYSFDGERARRLTRSGLFPEDDVSTIAVDSSGHLWAAGRYGGLAVYRSGYWTALHETDVSLAGERWRCAYASPQGAVYFGARGGTVLAVEGENLSRIRMPIGLAAPDAYGFAGADAGAVWFASGGRVLRADTAGTVADDGGPDGVNALARSPGGELWVASRWSVYRRSASGYEPIAVDTRERDPSFVSICWGRDGNLWVGLRSGAIYRHDGGIWMRMADAGECFEGAVASLAPGERTEVWAVGGGSCARFAAGGWRTFPADSFAGERVRDVVPTRSGATVATVGGLWELADDGCRRLGFTLDGGPPFPSGVEPLCLARDGAGRWYVGTTAGVLAVEGERARHYGVRSGLGEPVLDVFVESDRFLWIGFERDGVARVPLESLW
jgi:ligand-binding sensor domain-containing protein